jgi:hypothetical protein
MPKYLSLQALVLFEYTESWWCVWKGVAVKIIESEKYLCQIISFMGCWVYYHYNFSRFWC